MVDSVVPLFLALPMAMPGSGTFVFAAAAALPEWVGFLPAGLAVPAISAANGASASLWLADARRDRCARRHRHRAASLAAA